VAAVLFLKKFGSHAESPEIAMVCNRAPSN
jgi:hypothetical protein